MLRDARGVSPEIAGQHHKIPQTCSSMATVSDRRRDPQTREESAKITATRASLWHDPPDVVTGGLQPGVCNNTCPLSWRSKINSLCSYRLEARRKWFCITANVELSFLNVAFWSSFPENEKAQHPPPPPKVVNPLWKIQRIDRVNFLGWWWGSEFGGHCSNDVQKGVPYRKGG